MNGVINQLVPLFEMEYFSLPPFNAFVFKLQWHHFFLWCCLHHSLPFKFYLPSAEKSRYSKPSQTWDGWIWGRKEEKWQGVVVCDGFMPYLKTQLCPLTQLPICGYCSIFSWRIRKPRKKINRNKCVACILHSAGIHVINVGLYLVTALSIISQTI